MWYIVALFAVLTAILLSGKGGFLIAGYNTASKKEKAKYDEKKLSRVTGAGIGIITILLAILAAFKGKMPGVLGWLIPTLFAITILMILILTNTICKNKNLEQEETGDEKKRNRRILVFALVFIAILICVIAISLETGDIKYSVNSNAIDIDGSYWPDQSISYAEIQSVEFAESLDTGRRTNGYGSFKLQEGHFANSEFGKYILYAYAKCDSYIIIHTDTAVFVINAESKSETEKLYQEIKAKL